MPPARVSENAKAVPSGCSVVWPTRMPVLGSARVATSGSTRIGVGLVEPFGKVVARLFGTTPAWLASVPMTDPARRVSRVM